MYDDNSVLKTFKGLQRDILKADPETALQLISSTVKRVFDMDTIRLKTLFVYDGGVVSMMGGNDTKSLFVATLSPTADNSGVTLVIRDSTTGEVIDRYGLDVLDNGDE